MTECVVCHQRVCGHPRPSGNAEQLRDRFHRVILGAGYQEAAAQGILAEYFDQYMKDVPRFIEMLRDYEEGYYS
jgi:hypothetical protein